MSGRVGIAFALVRRRERENERADVDVVAETNGSIEPLDECV